MPTEIVRRPLKDQVRDILLDKIIAGELAPGDRLKIVPIADALKVSQAPVREAIQCLVTGGYMEQVPNVGARVRAYSAKELQEIYQFRKILEASALRDMIVGCEELTSILARHFVGMSQAAQNENFLDYAIHDTRFHRSIVESSGNGRMLDAWDGLRVPLHVVMTIKNRGLSLSDVLHLHSAIIKNLTNKEVERAVQALLYHYDFLRG